MEQKLKAFMSYTRFDNKHDGERLTQFREYLSAEVRAQTGEEFLIFQDIEHIQWGQHFETRIEDAIKEATFLIPIITPSFFKSRYCREELRQFLKREEQLQRNDLILPVYYIECPVLEDKSKQATDKLAQIIAARQYVDWRDLRFKDFKEVKSKLADMALQIHAAMERVQPPPPSDTPRSTGGVEEAQPLVEPMTTLEEKNIPFWRKVPVWAWALGVLAVLVVGVITAAPSVRGYFTPTPPTGERAATVAPVVLGQKTTTPSPSPSLTTTPTIVPTSTPTPTHIPIPPTDTPTQTPMSPTATATHTPRSPMSTPILTVPPPSTDPITLTIYLRDTRTETGFVELSGDQVNAGEIYEEGKYVYGNVAVQIGAKVYHSDEELAPGEPKPLPTPWRVEFEFAEALVARTGNQAGFDPKKAWFWVGTLDGDSATGEDHPYSLIMTLYEGNEWRKSIRVFFTVADAPEGGGGSEGGGGGDRIPPPP